MKQELKIKIFDFAIWHAFICLPIAGLLIMIGMFIADKNPSNLEKRQYARTNSLTNPLLECAESLNNTSDKTVNKIKNLLKEYINHAISSKRINTAAVYYRDLNNGPWFGINEKSDFAPASLLKVPLMIALFKQEELQPGFLEKTVTYRAESPKFIRYFADQKSLENGQTYRFRDLLKEMIKNSDNDAFFILDNNVDQQIYYSTYKDLGIDFPQSDAYAISTRTYASFFRILYNASYLNRFFSEEALRTLVGSSFSAGLRSGVPEKVKVAHKFGVRIFAGNPIKQLHDCGIIYHPDKPYILCLMTKGQDLDVMANTIKEIAELVYYEIDKNKMVSYNKE